MRHVSSDPSIAEVGKTVRKMALAVSAVACSISFLTVIAGDVSGDQRTAAPSAEPAGADRLQASQAAPATDDARAPRGHSGARLLSELTELVALLER